MLATHALGSAVGADDDVADLARGEPAAEQRGSVEEQAGADAVALAAGAGFYAAGKTPSLKEGVALAREVLASGEAYLLLERYVAFLRA